MNEAQTQLLLRRYAESIRKSWLSAIRSVDADATLATSAAERFADRVIRLAIQAGYREADYLRSGAFDPTLAAERFRVERGGLVSRFLADVRQSAPGLSVGLSARQRRDLRAFAVTLAGASLGAIDFNEPSIFNSREAALQAKRVELAMLRQRAKTIGRTEGLVALNLGIGVAIEQTTSLTGTEIKRTWKTAADEKVRSSHSPMNGQVRPLGEPFITGNGVAILYPGDPNAPVNERANCRCVLVTSGG